LAIARAAAVQQRKKGSQTTSRKEVQRYNKNRIKSVPSEAFATFRYSAHSVPKATNLFSNAWDERRVRA
jgi:hypothetical protein